MEPIDTAATAHGGCCSPHTSSHHREDRSGHSRHGHSHSPGGCGGGGGEHNKASGFVAPKQKYGGDDVFTNPPDGFDHSSSEISVEQVLREKRTKKALAIAVVFCFVFMVLEMAGGIIANSLALINDAIHMGTDVFNLSISLFAAIASTWRVPINDTSSAAAGRPSAKLSFGWRRMEVLGAMASVFTTWALILWIFVEAITRTVTIVKCNSYAYGEGDPRCEPIDAQIMVILGAIGFASNVVCACILMWGGHGHSHGGLYDTCDGSGHGHSHGGDDERHGLLCSGTVLTRASTSNDGSFGNGDSMNTVGNFGDGSPDHLAVSCSSPPAPQYGGASPLLSNPSSPHLIHSTTGCSDHGHAHDSHGHSHGSGGGCGGAGYYGEEDHGSDSHGHSHGGEGGAEKKNNMNIRGAMIHAIGDCLQSLGVMLAAAIIWAFNKGLYGDESDARSLFNLADPGCSVVFAVITIFTTKGLASDIFYILMEGQPPQVVVRDLKESILHVSGVKSISEMHVFSLNPNDIILTVRVTASVDSIETSTSIRSRIRRLASKQGIEHATIEVHPIA